MKKLLLLTALAATSYQLQALNSTQLKNLRQQYNDAVARNDLAAACRAFTQLDNANSTVDTTTFKEKSGNIDPKAYCTGTRRRMPGAPVGPMLTACQAELAAREAELARCRTDLAAARLSGAAAIELNTLKMILSGNLAINPPLNTALQTAITAHNTNAPFGLNINNFNATGSYLSTTSTATASWFATLLSYVRPLASGTPLSAQDTRDTLVEYNENATQLAMVAEASRYTGTGSTNNKIAIFAVQEPGINRTNTTIAGGYTTLIRETTQLRTRMDAILAPGSTANPINIEFLYIDLAP